MHQFKAAHTIRCGCLTRYCHWIYGIAQCSIHAPARTHTHTHTHSHRHFWVLDKPKRTKEKKSSSIWLSLTSNTHHNIFFFLSSHFIYHLSSSGIQVYKIYGAPKSPVFMTWFGLKALGTFRFGKSCKKSWASLTKSIINVPLGYYCSIIAHILKFRSFCSCLFVEFVFRFHAQTPTSFQAPFIVWSKFFNQNTSKKKVALPIKTQCWSAKRTEHKNQWGECGFHWDSLKRNHKQIRLLTTELPFPPYWNGIFMRFWNQKKQTRFIIAINY